MNKFILIFILFLPLFSLCQQTISGLIVDNNNIVIRNTPIKIALVNDPSTHYKTTTDNNGKFRLNVSVNLPQLFVVIVPQYEATERSFSSNQEIPIVISKNIKQINWEARYREMKRRAQKAEEYGRQVSKELKNLKTQYENRISELQNSNTAEEQRLRNRIAQLEKFNKDISYKYNDLSNTITGVRADLEKYKVKNDYLTTDLKQANQDIDEYKSTLTKISNNVYEIQQELITIKHIVYMEVEECHCKSTDSKNHITIQFTLVDEYGRIITTNENIVITVFKKKNMRENFTPIKSIQEIIPGNSYNYTLRLNSPNNFTQSTGGLINNFKIEIRHEKFGKPMKPLEIINLKKDCKGRV